MIVIPDVGAVELLGKTLKDALVTDESYSLRLFRNDYTPGASTVLGNFLESSFDGYFRRDLERALWATPDIVDGKARSVYTVNPIVWTCGLVGQTVYGYYVVAPSTARVVWCQRFETPRLLVTGNTLELSVSFTGRGQLS